MTVPSTVPVRFTVAWSGLDNLSGLREYDIQYKEGEFGLWQDWLTDTLTTDAPFIGTPDATYYFQVKATDNVNNESAWWRIGPVTVKSVTKYYTHGGQRACPEPVEGLRCAGALRYTICTAIIWGVRR